MKQTFIYIFMFLSIISQTSCEDQLNALPTQSKVEGNVIVDQASAEIALNGVYYRFASEENLRTNQPFYGQVITN